MTALESSLRSNWSELMEASLEGNKDAYGLLLREVTPALVGFVRKKVSNKEDVDDIVQETLIAIHTGRHTYRKGAPVAPWIWGIASFKVVDCFRKKGRLKKQQLAMEVDGVEYFQQFEMEASKRHEFSPDDSLAEALVKLNPKQRRAVELMKVEGLSAKEAAEQMNVSLASVKVLAHRGYNALRSILQGGEK